MTNAVNQAKSLTGPISTVAKTKIPLGTAAGGALAAWSVVDQGIKSYQGLRDFYNKWLNPSAPAEPIEVFGSPPFSGGQSPGVLYKMVFDGANLVYDSRTKTVLFLRAGFLAVLGLLRQYRARLRKLRYGLENLGYVGSSHYLRTDVEGGRDYHVFYRQNEISACRRNCLWSQAKSNYSSRRISNRYRRQSAADERNLFAAAANRLRSRNSNIDASTNINTANFAPPPVAGAANRAGVAANNRPNPLTTGASNVGTNPASGALPENQSWGGAPEPTVQDTAGLPPGVYLPTGFLPSMIPPGSGEAASDGETVPPPLITRIQKPTSYEKYVEPTSMEAVQNRVKEQQEQWKRERGWDPETNRWSNERRNWSRPPLGKTGVGIGAGDRLTLEEKMALIEGLNQPGTEPTVPPAAEPEPLLTEEEIKEGYKVHRWGGPKNQAKKELLEQIRRGDLSSPSGGPSMYNPLNPEKPPWFPTIPLIPPPVMPVKDGSKTPDKALDRPKLPDPPGQTKPSPCNNPGTCSGKILSGQGAIGGVVNNNNVVINNLAPDLGLLKVIDNKLGPQLADGGVGGTLKTFYERWNKFAEWIKLDRILNVMTLWVSLHNAYMLSNSLGQTLFSTIDNVLSLFGIYVKDAEGEEIGIGGAFKETLENIAKGIFGVDEWEVMKTDWAKYSRIYQAASNLMWAMRSLIDSVTSALEIIGSYVALIGNALKKWGAVGERAYQWMNPNPNYSNRFFTAIDKAENIVSDIDNITSEAHSVTETVDQISTTRSELRAGVAQLDETPQGQPVPQAEKVLETETQSKENSQPPAIPEEALVAPEVE